MSTSPVEVNRPVPAGRLPAGRRSSLRRALAITGALVLMLVVGGVSYAGAVLFSLRNRFQDIPRVEITSLAPLEVPAEPVPDDVEPAAPQPQPGQALNFLLIGSDSREGVASDDPFLAGDFDGERADVILLVHLNDPAYPGPVLVPIPRDLLVDMPCDDWGMQNRVNASLNGCTSPEVSGPELVVQTVGELTGLPIHHFAAIDFRGFAAAVDALGGVELCFANDTRDNSSGLWVSAGCDVLDGEMALAYARSRHYEEYIDGVWQETSPGDLNRIDRQEQLLFAILGEAASFGSIDDLLGLSSALGSHLVLDDTLSFGDAAALAWRNRSTRPASVTTVNLPVAEESIEGLGSILRLDESAETLWAALADHDPLPLDHAGNIAPR